MDPDGLPPFETPDWLRDDEDDGHGRRTSRTAAIVALAAIPWIVVATLVLRPDPAPRAPAVVGAVEEATSEPAAPADVPTSTAPAGQVHTFGETRSSTTLADAAAVAVPVARAWASGAGSALPLEGMAPTGEPVYVEHLAVEAVDLPAPGAAVVTLLAVVLEVDDGRYGDAHVRRLAVPVHVDEGGARPAGAPWWLPSPDLGVAPAVTGEPIDDPDLVLEAAEAVAAAGYADVDVTSLAASDGWALVATVRATAPGADAPADHVLWLRRHLEGLVVAGWRPTDLSPPPDGGPGVGPAEPDASHEEGAP